MSQSSNTAAPARTGKMTMQMIVGAIIGGAASYALLSFVGKSRFELDDTSRVVALITGLVFALIGLIVGLGVLAPKSGAHLLNVEDAEELREQRGPLWRAALATMLLGVILMVLALGRVGGSAGLFSTGTATAVAAICFVGVVIASVAARNDHDELMRSVSREAMTMSMYTLTALVGVWAAAAHLGYVEWMGPLDMISALLVVQLVAIMVVTVKRGLHRPR